VPAGVNGNLVINIIFPPNYGFTEGAPMDYNIEPCKGIKIEEKYQKVTMKNPKSPLMIPFSTSDPEECQIKLNLTFNYCDKAKGLCTIESIRWQIPIEIVKNEGDSRIVIEHKVTPKE
jgi:hypothetical protein